ncbi:uncharacterized protein LOC143345661 [Colletes latitarsis]|uniref:uncharacterized protein LOC143345661 n=1 Tax=Colletes latitarsis TaxID=2605962 RepID=UPI004036FE5A
MAKLEPYYKLSATLMSFIGLWPYQNINLRRLKTGLISLSNWYFMFVLLMVFKTTKFTLSLLLKNLSPIIMFMGCLLKYNAFWYQTDTIKEFMERVRYDWNTKQDEILKILQKHATIGRHYAKLYAMFVYPSAVIVTIFQVAAFVFVTDASTNGTRVNYFPIMTEYLMDEEKYLYFIVFHQNFTLFLCASTFVATETLYIMWLQHAAGLFEITSYHIDKAVSAESMRLPVSQEHSDRNSKRFLVSAVIAHKNATKFATDLRIRFQASYSVLLILGVVSLSVNFFRLSQAVFLTHDVEEFLISLLFSISELVYMFYINYLIQQLLDCANSLVTVIYDTKWYKRSIIIQKLLLIIMTRCNEPFHFSFYNFYSGSIEGFSTLVKSTVSYFMVMSSFEC